MDLLSVHHHKHTYTPTHPSLSPRSHLYRRSQANPLGPSFRYGYGAEFRPLVFAPEPSASLFSNFRNRKRDRRTLILRAWRRESPYEVLGVSPSATSDEIKRAYRKLALRYHPDVSKEANAKDKFMRVKHAYNTLLNSDSRRKYDSGSSSGFSYSSSQRSQSRNTQAEEEFYGLEDFFKDIQEEFRNWEANAQSQENPKSLWEELAEIGEEFVEFLEKELSIVETTAKAYSNDEPQEDNSFNSSGTKGGGNNVENDHGKDKSIEDNIDEIEATLARLKEELGL